MKELQATEAAVGEKMLRLSVETGGCSGFQYVFDLDDKTSSDDRYMRLHVIAYPFLFKLDSVHQKFYSILLKTFHFL